MKNRVIKVSLSQSSILEAYGKLSKYRTALKRAVSNANFRLKQDAKRALEAYVSASYVHDVDDEGHSVIVTADDTQTGFILTMTGDAVGFIEFGTGAYVDEQHAFREDAPFPVFSGSYSDTVGAGTWNAWIKAGKDPNKYPYNRYPTYPLYNTSLWIRDNWAEYLRREIEAIDIG